MSRRVEVALALLLAVAVALAIVAGRRGSAAPEIDFRASTLHAGPYGSRALYDVLARLGVPLERRRTPLFGLAKGERRPPPAVLVAVDPPLDLEAAELAQVVRFVRSGGAVVIAGSGGGITHCVGWRTQNEARLFRTDSFRVVPAAPGLALPPVADFLAPREAAEERRGLRGGAIEVDECETLPAAAQDTLLRLVNGRPAVLRLRYAGGGSVTLVADPGYFRNRTWRESGVPYFMTPLLMPSRRGRVVWDEYHQGFGEGRSMAGVFAAWLVGSPAGRALLQLLGVLLVGLAVAAVRFGPPRRVIERRRRSPLEHLEALAAGLEGAGGVDTAVTLTVAGLRRRLGRTGALAPGEQRSWLGDLELALPTERGRDAVRRLQRIISQPGGPERALAAAQAAEDVWEELRPQTTRSAS